MNERTRSSDLTKEPVSNSCQQNGYLSLSEACDTFLWAHSTLTPTQVEWPDETTGVVHAGTGSLHQPLPCYRG